ncbi:MAG: tetratricopeptide repeat protein [Desulfobacteraceae bacterium]|nr:tetratricopeptide repeat protein [Desulfobacteraceae bacterium]
MKSDTFLLVDDNAFALKELKDLMKYMGFKDLQLAENANNAWSLLRTKPCDCIIAAWDMEEMAGIALLKIIRSDDNFKNIPFFLTDSAFTKVKVIKAGLSGVTGLIVTPYDQENLKSKLETINQDKGVGEFVVEEEKLDQGMELIERGHFEEAIDVLDDMINTSETAEYYYNIGYLKTAESKYSEAIEAFKKATQLDHLFAKAYEGLGRAYQAMGQSELAEKHLQKAADIHMDKENVEDAESILNEILEISKDSVNVFNSLGVLYRKKGDFKNALKNYEKALKVHPEETYILYNMGRLFLDMKDPAKASEFFEKAVIIDPDFKEARQVLDAIELGTI